MVNLTFQHLNKEKELFTELLSMISSEFDCFLLLGILIFT